MKPWGAVETLPDVEREDLNVAGDWGFTAIYYRGSRLPGRDEPCDAQPDRTMLRCWGSVPRTTTRCTRALQNLRYGHTNLLVAARRSMRRGEGCEQQAQPDQEG